MTDTPAALTAAIRMLGWSGTPLPATSLLGCRLVPVVHLDPRAHRIRAARGVGPQTDENTLAIWEWPQPGFPSPQPTLRLEAAIFQASAPCTRRDLAAASGWRGFGAAAVLVPAGEPVDDVLRMEFGVQGIGLAVGTDLVVPPAVGRRETARRRVADRWIEEMLYRHALDTGRFDSSATHQGAGATVGTGTRNQ